MNADNKVAVDDSKQDSMTESMPHRLHMRDNLLQAVMLSLKDSSMMTSYLSEAYLLLEASRFDCFLIGS